MNLNLKNLKSVTESADALQMAKANNEFLDLYKNICPVSGYVYDGLKSNAADPASVKTVVCGDHMYCEAREFFTFANASGNNLREAAEELILVNHNDAPGVSIEKFHVVFPNQGEVEGEGLDTDGLGLGIKQSTAVKLINGCLHYGLTVNAAPGMLNDNTSVKTEAATTSNNAAAGDPPTEPTNPNEKVKTNGMIKSDGKNISWN